VGGGGWVGGSGRGRLGADDGAEVEREVVVVVNHHIMG